MKNQLIIKLLFTFFLILLTPQVTEAKIETFNATGEYTVSKKETIQQAEDAAFAEALRSISEQVGVLVSSNTQVKNSSVTHDEIVTISRNLIKVISKKFERNVTSAGDIHIIAHVTGNVDSDVVISEITHASSKSRNNSDSNKTSTVSNNKSKKGNISPEYDNAIRQAEYFSSQFHLSQKNLLRQLLYNGFSKEIAMSAINSIKVDYKKNALEKAEQYLQTMFFSKKGIYHQLFSPSEGFTHEEALYAMNNVVADWNAQALGKAEQYQLDGLSKKAIYNQLIFEGFTKNEANYAISKLS